LWIWDARGKKGKLLDRIFWGRPLFIIGNNPCWLMGMGLNGGFPCLHSFLGFCHFVNPDSNPNNRMGMEEGRKGEVRLVLVWTWGVT